MRWIEITDYEEVNINLNIVKHYGDTGFRENYQDYRNKSSIGHITDFFMDNSMYREDYGRIKQLAKKFIEKYIHEETILKRENYMLSFSTEDLSLSIVIPPPSVRFSDRDKSIIKNPILKVRRDEEGYLTLDTFTDGIDEEDIVSLYKEVIDYAFFLQKKLVKTYGEVEYILEFFVSNTWDSIVHRNMFLLTEDREMISIEHNI